MTGLNH